MNDYIEPINIISAFFNNLELFCNATFKASRPKSFGSPVVVMGRYRKNYNL